MPALDPAIDARVEAHWQRAQAGRSLFNGRVFCVTGRAVSVLSGHWTEYRRVVAQMAEPGLFDTLRIRSLAVCGVLCCPGGVVVGRREATSLYQAGLWQLSPAGSVDDGAAIPGGADWRQAILAELLEELGLPPASVGALTPFCLVQHPAGVLDLGIRVDTDLDAAEIMSRHRSNGNGEYEALRILPQDQLLATVAAEGGTLVPAAALLLANMPSR